MKRAIRTGVALLAAGLMSFGMTAAAAAEEADLTFAFWSSEDDVDMNVQLIYDKVDEFNEANEGKVKVDVMYIPMDQYWAKIAALSASESMPDILMMSPGERCRDYVQAGSLLNLTEYVEGTDWGNSFVNGALTQMTFDEQVYAIPTYKTSACMFYNTELFEQAGVKEIPKTWEEFLAVCGQLQDAGIQPIAMSCKDPDTWCTAMFTAYLVQRIGGTEPIEQIANREEGYTFDQECFIKAGEMTKELLDLGYIQPTAIADSNAQATELVRSGQAAMLAQGSWAIGQLENPEESSVAGKMGVFSFPTVEGGVGKNMWMSKYSCYSIGSQTKYPQECVSFLQALTSEDIEKNFAEIGGVIPAVSVEIDTQKCPAEFKFISDELEKSEGDFPFFDEMLGTTIGNEWNSTLGSICAGTKTSEQAFKDLQLYTEKNTAAE